MKNTTQLSYLHSNSKTFKETIHALLVKMTDKQRIVSLSFFGASTEADYEEQFTVLKTEVLHAFDGKMPLVTYIIQPLGSPEEMAVEVFRLSSGTAYKSVEYKTKGDVRYVVFEWMEHKALMIEGVRAKSTLDSVAEQSDEIFQKIDAILYDEQIGIHEIVRQWNYIGKITDYKNGIQNYQAFNNARARFYSKADWGNCGYPAATGIGMAVDGILVSLIAVSSKADIQITPIDNPLQIAAHHYSQSMLLGPKRNETPKFERAKWVRDGFGGVCFISGTAAIRGEQSMHDLDVVLQTRQTIENIQYLVSSENLKRHGVINVVDLNLIALRVYIKNLDFLNTVKAEVEKVWPSIPVLYIQADICRTELLVEIEGLATQD
ncbi:MAG TPA: hypothetical protein VFP20_07425 [Bacteroidales bacterium]|nr:hypothetical protein [Bacteroidales bacterium]